MPRTTSAKPRPTRAASKGAGVKSRAPSARRFGKDAEVPRFIPGTVTNIPIVKTNRSATRVVISPDPRSHLSAAGRLNSTVLEDEIALRYHARGAATYSIGHDEYVREINRFILTRYRACLAQRREVALLNLGTLRPAIRKSARYVHPSTGEVNESPDRLGVKFVASPNLRAALKAKSC